MRRRSDGSHWVAWVAVVALLAPLVVAPAIAPATVAEQRARLPPAAACEGPIEGTWRGLSWYPLQRQWYEFTLEIRRRPGSESELTGTIVAHFWDRTLESSEPGPCRDLQRVRIRQPAAGRFAGGPVDFGGTAWEVEEVACGAWHGTAYVLESLQGHARTPAIGHSSTTPRVKMPSGHT